MSEVVPAADIEAIVGATRHPTDHLARAVSTEKRVYILHSQACFDSTPDLRECEFSLALDGGIDIERWVEDQPLLVGIEDGKVTPR